MKKKPIVSVIIPTYHDWNRLQLCLNSLEKQTCSKDKYEIVVVNNDPSDQAPNSLWLPENCVLITEGKPGSYAARNKGAAFAKGGVLTFTDADCLPEKNWVENIICYFSENDGLLSGSVKMFSTLDNGRLNFSESYDFVFGINQDLYAKNRVGATANLSVTSKDFKRIGGFDSSLLSGGDVDFCKKAKSKKIDFFYSEACVVFHPLRNNIDLLLVKAKRLVAGKVKKKFIKGFLTALSPPIVRLYILFFKKEAAFSIKFKCFMVLFFVKVVQVVEVFRVIFGFVHERR